MHSRIMLEVGTAKAWKKSPSEFASLSDDDKAFMIAYEETNARISSANAFIAEKKAKEEQRKNRPRPSRKGRNR